MTNCRSDLHCKLIGAQFFQNIFRRRNLLLELVRRDFEQRYVGSAAGWLWGLIQPIFQIISWTFVFQYCLKTVMPVNGLTENYTLYLLCGYLPWMLFQETVQRGTGTLVDNANLITKTVFPSEILPIAVFLSSLIHHGMAVGLTVVVIAIWDHHLHPFVLLLPVYALLVGVLAIGIAWVTSALQVYLRDTAQAVMVGLNFMLWMTPIFIAEEQVPKKLAFVIRYNPLTYLVRAYRERLLSENWPHMGDLAITAIYASVIFVAGGLFFRHVKRGFADVL